MRIFIDSADLEEIKTGISWGIIDGVTTNPSLIKKAIEKYGKGNFSMEDYIKELLRVAGRLRPVSLEVVSVDTKNMVIEGEVLYTKFNYVANNVVIKIPINPNIGAGNNFDGLLAAKELKNRGIPVNITLVMTAEQAMLAGKIGADYVSPFIGRIDDFLRTNANLPFKKSDYYPEEGIYLGDKLLEDNGAVSGVHMLSMIKEIFENYHFNTKIIAASVRNARQVREVALLGCDIATVPFSVLVDLVNHPKTEEGMKNFIKDVEEEYKKIFEKGV
ncbi:MAG: transaldolase [Caldisericaceae bacterium]